MQVGGGIARSWAGSPAGPGPVSCDTLAVCGRFTQRLSSGEFARIFGAEDLAATTGEAYNVAPTQRVAAVVVRDDRRVLDRFRWGLVPGWADRVTIGSRLINARAETVASTPAFRHSFRARRCLIPADGFYEWRRAPDGTRQPFYITAAGGAPLVFAGLWSAWRDPSARSNRSGAVDGAPEGDRSGAADAAPGGDRSGAAGAPPLLTCSIVTTTPNALMATLHNRMPVILEPDAWDLWLDPAVADPGELQALLHPSDADLVAWPVSDLVNSPRNQGPGLIEPVAP